MQQRQPSQSQQKNHQFRNEIRNKMKTAYLKNIRNEFLRLQNNTPKNDDSNNNSTLRQLQQLVNQVPSRESMARMNRIIIDRSGEIEWELFEKLVAYVSGHFLGKQAGVLAAMGELNDLIALFSNLLALENYHHELTKQINLQQAFDTFLSLTDKAPIQSGSLCLWTLSQLVKLCPASTATKIADLQNDLVDKFTLSDINLNYLLYNLEECNSGSILPSIVREYTGIQVPNEEGQYFYRNLVSIFRSFVTSNKGSAPEIKHILKWISSKLMSPSLSPPVKTSLLQLVHKVSKSQLSLQNQICFLNNPSLIYQLTQRALYDTSSSNKTYCLLTLAQLIQACPQLQLSDLVTNYESIVEVMVSAMRMGQVGLVLGALQALTRMIILWPNNREIQGMLERAGFRLELEALELSQNQNISQLATAILKDYMQEDHY